MTNFTVIKQSKKSRARLGFLKTEHGVIETPSLVPVATQAVVKTLTSEEVRLTGSQMLICNTFHLHLKPGERIVKRNGGLNKFMNWSGPLMTDSGGFQVFSLGFGRDFKIGKIAKASKIIKESRASINSEVINNTKSLSDSHDRENLIVGQESVLGQVKLRQQPQRVKITESGVHFQSPIDGRRLFLGPKESIKIQESLGADIIFAFDECTPPNASYDYTIASLEKTHRWATECLKFKNLKRQALFGIVQGGRFKDLRIKSAKVIGQLSFDGFGIGGEFGDNKKIMTQMLRCVIKELPNQKPRHLLGIGRLEDIPKLIREGVDTFDCIVPTHYARHGVAFTSQGKLDLNKTIFLKDKKPIDPKCACQYCLTIGETNANYTRSYICHLLKAKEITPLKILTFHNLFFFNNYVAKLREDIKNGNL